MIGVRMGLGRVLFVGGRSNDAFLTTTTSAPPNPTTTTTTTTTLPPPEVWNGFDSCAGGNAGGNPITVYTAAGTTLTEGVSLWGDAYFVSPFTGGYIIMPSESGGIRYDCESVNLIYLITHGVCALPTTTSAPTTSAPTTTAPP